MKEDYTHICICLDRSGSMASIAADTIGGFNAFIEQQKGGEGRVTVSLVGFDDKYEVWRDFTALDELIPLDEKTFIPRGSTALYDAMGRLIMEVGAKLSSMPESERPGRVLFLTITDGHENASREYTHKKVAAMVELQQTRYLWSFAFIGPDLASMDMANSLHIPAQSRMTFTPKTVRPMMAKLGRATAGARAAMSARGAGAIRLGR